MGLTAVDNLDGSVEPWCYGRRATKGEDLTRSKRLLGRLGELKNCWVEETWIKEGFFIAAGVRPGKVTGGEVSKSPGLIITSQLACPSVKGWIYVSEVLGEGCEDQAITGGGVPNGLSVYTGSDLEK